MFDVSVHIRCKTCYAVLIFEILTFIFMDKTKVLLHRAGLR